MQIYNKCVLFISCLIVISAYPNAHTIKKIIKAAPLIPRQKLSDDFPGITVIVHGSRLFGGASYQKYFNGKPGLKHASTFPKHKYTYKWLQELSICAPDLFPYEQLYYFGWSGLLSVRERDKATVVLYDALLNCAQHYFDEYHTWPEIRLICHSHGGNVALSLARIHAKRKTNLVIDKLILLGCPVQYSTRCFADSPLFINVYSYYACLDFIQVMAPEITEYVYDDQGNLIDCIRRWYLFSKRTFNSMFVKEARIMINRHSIDHSCYTNPVFLCNLPQLMRTMDDVYKQHTNRCKELVCVIKCK